MANCMTCRHNDKKAKYCPVKKAHTDLGYVLNCIAWTPTDEAEMKRLRTENDKLRELVHEALLFGNERSYQEIRYRLKQQARELGVEVDE